LRRELAKASSASQPDHGTWHSGACRWASSPRSAYHRRGAVLPHNRPRASWPLLRSHAMASSVRYGRSARWSFLRFGGTTSTSSGSLPRSEGHNHAMRRLTTVTLQ
jgi:hypothetical protein